eukprot:scaffold12361_cov113-Isochrysis_galbana.AAC.3
MWHISAQRVSHSLLPDRGREWQAQGQLRSLCAGGQAGERGRRAGQCGRAERAPGRQNWRHNRYRDGRGAAAAPTAAATCQEPRRSALAAANRAGPMPSAGPSWAGKAGRAGPSSLRTQGALRGAMRARFPPGCRALGPALGDVPMPTLPGTDRQP